MRLVDSWLTVLFCSYRVLHVGAVPTSEQRRAVSDPPSQPHRLESRVIEPEWEPVGPHGPYRTITLVSDTLIHPNDPTGHVLKDPQTSKYVRPQHTWVVFGAAIDQQGKVHDGPLRVELVAPIMNNVWQGLSIAVTDHTVTRDDEGQENWPLLGRTRTRVTKTLTAQTRLTNEQLFSVNYNTDKDPDGGPPKPEAPPGLIQDIWFKLGYQLVVQEQGRDSQWFVEQVLQHPGLALDMTEPDWRETYEAISQFGQGWARARRHAVTSTDRKARIFATVPYIFYEARRPNHPAPEHSGQLWKAGQSRHLQYFYQLIRTGEFNWWTRLQPIRLNRGWTGGLAWALEQQKLASETASSSTTGSTATSSNPAPGPARLFLSRDPRLTLDAPLAHDDIRLATKEKAASDPARPDGDEAVPDAGTPDEGAPAALAPNDDGSDWEWPEDADMPRAPRAGSGMPFSPPWAKR